MKGGCHCGAIRFEVKGKPSWVGACHCVDCRKIRGSPFLVFAEYNLKNFKLLKGKPKIYHSSRNVKRSFCSKCSSPISYICSKDKGKIFIAIGIFDNPKKFKIKEHIWKSQKLPWVKI